MLALASGLDPPPSPPPPWVLLIVCICVLVQPTVYHDVSRQFYFYVFRESFAIREIRKPRKILSAILNPLIRRSPIQQVASLKARENVVFCVFLRNREIYTVLAKISIHTHVYGICHYTLVPSPYGHKYAPLVAWDVWPYLGTELLCVLFIRHFLSLVMFVHFNHLDTFIVLSFHP